MAVEFSPILDLHQFGLFAESRSFRLVTFNLGSMGLLSRDLLTSGPIDQRWVAQLTSGNQKQTEWRLFDGLIAACRGTVGRVRCFDPGRTFPYLDLTSAKTTVTFDDATTFSDGTGWLDGKLPPFVAVDRNASGGARSLVARGFPASTAGVLRWGDLFELRPSGVPADHGHLYIVKGVSNSDADGMTRVSFEPGLRRGIAAGDMIVLQKPSTVFRLASENEGEMTVSAPNTGRFGLSLIEILPRA